MTESAFYLGEGAACSFVVFHPAAALKPAPSVLLLPPFGWDEIASYRARREWALHLAARGHAVLRVDLPGTGDSPGSLDNPKRWESWQTAVRSALAWLAATTGTPPVALGMGLSGYLAWSAASTGDVGRVVLWGTPARGRRLLRELRAFAALETTRIGAPEHLEPVHGLEVGGFVLPATIVDVLEKLDLGDVPVPSSVDALVLGRDGIPADPVLVQAVHRTAGTVTTGAGQGYGAMLVQPDRARAPLATFEEVDRWLSAGLRDGAVAVPSSMSAPTAPELSLGRLGERPVSYPRDFGSLRAVITEGRDASDAPLTLVYLNAGAVSRIGPNRMWVESAREWAARGIPSLRLDVKGIGDSDGDSSYEDVRNLYDDSFAVDVRAALDELERAGLPNRFVLVGLCSGGFWAYHVLLADERAVAAVMLNPRILFWHEHLDALRDLRRTRLLARPRTWSRLMRGEVPFRRWVAFAGWLSSAAASRLKRPERGSVFDWQAQRIAKSFAELQRAGRRARFIFCDGEPLHDELLDAALLGGRSWPNVFLEEIPGRDHTFRPTWMQQAVARSMAAAIAAEVTLAARAGDSTPEAERRHSA